MALAETARLIAQLVLDDKLTPGVNKALGSVGKLDKGFGRTAAGLGKVQSGLVKAGTRIAAIGVTAAGAAAKLAIDFDDAFASVEKNVEGTSGEISNLKDDLHALATRVPVSFKDLTAIAAEAGALGIATKDVVRFTETMARLSQSTQGLTVEAASEAFGKFRNSLHLTEDEIERSASALVTLGKTAGSSEGDIIEVAKRFAGAGHSSKLSAAQILGLSSAIASLGVAPEAAGGSLSRLFNKVNLFIGTGDKKLKQFAKTAGMTSDAFAKGFKKDALGTFEKFLAGLSKLSGPEQAARLSAAGIVNVRDISALQLLAGSWQEVQRQTDAATQSYRENTDLTDTSNKRFDTISKKLTVLGNNFKEVGFQIGEGMLPAIGRASDKLTKLLQDPQFLKRAAKIGETIGEALDSIDWDQVLKGAQSFADALKPALTLAQNIFNIVNALPTEVKGAGLGLIGLNKLSGGLIGGGIGDIVGGLGESFAKGGLSHVPGVNSLVATPVRVVNWPAGGLGAAGGAGAAAGGSSRLAKGLAAVSVIADIAAVVETQQQVSAQISQQGQDLQAQLASGISVKTPQELQTALAAVNTGIDRIQSNPLNVLVQGSALDSLKSMKASLEDQIKATSGGGRDTDKLGSGLLPATKRAIAGLGGSKSLEAKLDKNIDKLAHLEGQLARAKESGDNRRISNLRQRIETTNQRIDSAKQTLTSTTVATRDAARHAGTQTASAMDAAAAAITRAIFAAQPQISLFVTSSNVESSINRGNRAGPRNGSSGGDGRGGRIPG